MTRVSSVCEQKALWSYCELWITVHITFVISIRSHPTPHVLSKLKFYKSDLQKKIIAAKTFEAKLIQNYTYSQKNNSKISSTLAVLWSRFCSPNNCSWVPYCYFRFYFIQHISILVLFSPTALYPATNGAIATFYSWWSVTWCLYCPCLIRSCKVNGHWWSWSTCEWPNINEKTRLFLAIPPIEPSCIHYNCEITFW